MHRCGSTSDNPLRHPRGTALRLSRQRALAECGLVPDDVRPILDQIRKHEIAHVALLRKALCSQAAAKRSFDFTAGGMFADVFSISQTFLMLTPGVREHHSACR